MIQIKSTREIELIRQSGHLAAHILDEAANYAQAGVTTNDINNLVHNLTLEAGALPATLGYRGYPKSVCTSVNEVVTHGIPSSYTLKDGDILNIDVTNILHGYHGDCSKMVLIGNVNPSLLELVKTTEYALQQSILALKPNLPLSIVGDVIHNIADEKGYSVVRDYCGHGIGRKFHEDPLVLHYRTGKQNPRLRPGMVFTIEPMINLGGPKTKTLADTWTVVTLDGQPSAQFEHTLVITDEGAEILTPWKGLFF